jgi:hypothetical protein
MGIKAFLSEDKDRLKLMKDDSLGKTTTKPRLGKISKIFISHLVSTISW